MKRFVLQTRDGYVNIPCDEIRISGDFLHVLLEGQLQGIFDTSIILAGYMSSGK